MSKIGRNAAILATRSQVAQPSGMTERPKLQQKKNRQRRLSVALRENLKRRKVQARGRTQESAGADEAGRAKPHESAGFDKDNRNQ
jgi:hypothetical protein